MCVSRSKMAPTSRAMPTMDRQSGRFGVISQSSTVSELPWYSANGTPTGASSGRIMMPEWSPESPSSRAEQFMPQLTTPRSLLFLILTPPGSSAPTSAVTIWSPCSKFWAPHTMVSGSGSPSSPRLQRPTSTLHTHMWSESGCGSFETTRAVTTWSNASPTVSIDSTSVPVRMSSAESSSGDSGTSMSVFSQLYDTFISSSFSTMLHATVPQGFFYIRTGSGSACRRS